MSDMSITVDRPARDGGAFNCSPAMALKVDEVSAEYGGDKPFVFWIDGSFQPKVWLVLGDSEQDAYDSFLVIPQVEAQLKFDDDDDRSNYGADYEPDVNDNGVELDAESVQWFATSWAHICRSSGEPIY
jgi:hypothetical protein